MPEIKLQHVISFTSEDKAHCAENLLKSESYRKWKCEAGEKQASIILQFEKASKIHSIDIGNENSAFIEVLVARSSETNPNYQVLLVASSFMTPGESKSGTNVNRVRMFGSEKLSKTAADQKWDLVKIVCTQPFNKSVQYGLSFIKFHSQAVAEEKVKESTNTSTPKITKIGSFSLKNEEESSFAPGSLFASKRKTSPTSSLQGAAAIRHASTILSASSPTLNKPSLSKDIKTSSLQPAFKSKDELQEGAAKKHFTTVPYSSRLSSASSESKTYMPVVVKKSQTSSSPSPKPSLPSFKPSSIKNNTTRESQTLKRKNSEALKQSKDVPFFKIMEGVVFVLSGFQNPGRGHLREKALEMGAKYKPDWEESCTHLVCAFANTPKHRQVQRLGGRVVRKEWILECHKKKRLLPWKMFRLASDSEEEEEDDDNDETYEEEEEDDEEEEDLTWDEEEEEKDSTSDEKDERDGDSEDEIPKKKKALSKPKSSTSKSPLKVVKKKTSTPKKTSQSFIEKKSSLKKLDSLDDDESVESLKKSRHYSSEEESGGDTEDEIRKVREEEKNKSKNQSRTNDSKYEGSTDEDAELDKTKDTKSSVKRIVENGILSTSKESVFPLPHLPSFFKEKHFLLFGDFDEETRKKLKRYIIAYGGKLENYMDQSVSFIITSSDWDDNFDEALNENGALTFVRPQWIFTCNDKGKFVPYQPYVVVPKVI